MSRIGILGGMGPSATVDFMDKIIQLTPATRDQEHLPVIVASLPQVPDRSSAILGHGDDPLPALLRGIDVLNQAAPGVIALEIVEDLQAALVQFKLIAGDLGEAVEQ